MKTTKKDFEIFKKECEKWIKFFELKEWRIEYDHAKLKDGIRAENYYDIPNRSCDIILNTELNNNCKKVIKKLAFHEVCEVLLCEATGHLSDYYSNNKVLEIVHTIIRHLENSVFKKFYE